MIDIAAIIENTDALTVATCIGMEIQKGKRIRCPGHKKRLGKEDNHIGNAVLTPKGYHCFACGVTVGMIEMVQEFLGCNKYEAICHIADTVGGIDNFVIDGDPKPVREPEYSEEFMHAIGLNAPKRACTTETRFDEYGLCSPGYDPSVRFGYAELCEKDPAAAQRIIRNEADKYLASYNAIAETACSPSAPQAEKVFELANVGNRLQKDFWRNLKRETEGRITQIRLGTAN